MEKCASSTHAVAVFDRRGKAAAEVADFGRHDALRRHVGGDGDCEADNRHSRDLQSARNALSLFAEAAAST